jgi:hypothetical protein
MKISSTTQVEEIKDVVSLQYKKSVEVLTPSGNIAGDKRRVRALTSKEDVEFPVEIESSNFDSFIRQCKRKLGLKIILSRGNPESKDLMSNTNASGFDLGNLLYNQIPEYLLRALNAHFKQKNFSGCVEFNKSLIQFINSNLQYYWLSPLATKVFERISDDDEVDFSYTLSTFGLNINHNDLTVYFDESRDVINAEAFFEQAKDFKWYITEEDREERVNGGNFIEAVLKKNNATLGDFEDPTKREYLFNLCISTFFISSAKFQSESDDFEEGFSTLIWTVLESVGFEHEVLNEFTNHLPVFVIENLKGEDIENYNSEENSEYQSYRGYATDWKAIASSIFEGSGFEIIDNGILGSGFLDEKELETTIVKITNSDDLVMLPSGSLMSIVDLPVEKMTIVDFKMIQHVFPENWVIPNSNELKEMYQLKLTGDYIFDDDEAYISSEDLNVFSTGVLFFDDGEFDERNGKLYAGKIRLVFRKTQ